MLPSSIEVKRFARARAPELQSLYAALNATQRTNHHKPSDGANVSGSASKRPPAPRRRTTSHNRRKPFRWARKPSKQAPGERLNPRKFPAVADAGVDKKADVGSGGVEGSDGEPSGRVAAGDVGQSIGNSMPLNGSSESSVKKRKEARTKTLSRRVRRRIELKVGSDGDGGRSSDGTQRLATHVWHAKRFEMAKMWGYWLAKGFPGRGRGSRALLKIAKTGALIHDASYYNAIEIRGCMDVVLETLELVLEPSPSTWRSSTDADESEDLFVCYENAMLHEPEKAPYKPIAPVMVVRHPPCVKLQRDLGHFNGDHAFSTCEKTEPNPSFRTSPNECHLWIWVHPAAFEIAFKTLQIACNKKITECGRAIVSCQSRKGEFGRLDVVGARAFQVLQQVLSPVTSGTSINVSNIKLLEPFKVGDEGPPRFSELQQINKLPDKGILPMEVHDPRNLPKAWPLVDMCTAEQLEYIRHEGSNFGRSSSQENCMTNSFSASDLSPGIAEASCKRSNTEDINMIFQGPSSDCHRLWKCDSCRDSHLIKPPVSVKSLCARKHKDRLSFFHMSHEANTTTNMDTFSLSGGPTCPILLVKHLHRGSSSCRWSIILPMSWVRAFWLPLLSAGARAIGQREHWWFLTDAGLPSFPFDFPDISSYAINKGVGSRFSKNKVQQDLLKELLKNPSPPPPWICMLKNIYGQMWAASKLEVPREVLDCHSPFLCSGEEGKTGKPGPEEIWKQPVIKFPGFVARTSWALNIFLQENNLRHLLIFPGGGNYSKYFVQDELKTNLAWKAVASEEQQHLQCTTVVSLFKELKTPCFLRVLIRAPRKGVLEEGALIFLPTLQHLNAWFSRSNKFQGSKETMIIDRAVSIAEGAVSNDSSSLLKDCEESRIISLKGEVDHKSNCFYKQPIGFVTSPAPRESIFASAFIEVCSLGKIRSMLLADKRWGNSKEVFCLFKNERSDTFRPALALIILETTDDLT